MVPRRQVGQWPWHWSPAARVCWSAGAGTGTRRGRGALTWLFEVVDLLKDPEAIGRQQGQAAAPDPERALGTDRV
jgi:hypothetical protein